MSIDSELTHTAFNNREYMFKHIPYNKEVAFFQSIQSGDLRAVKRLFTPLCSTAGYGKLSENPLRNLKYHLVVSVAFITRYCIEGGLEEETAYNMSDIYIRRVDTCSDEESVHALHEEIVREFTRAMKNNSRHRLYSKPITKCIDYIYNNLHSRITLDSLAEEAGLSESYLSKLFHSEVGVTVVQYIMNKKIDAAKNLLIFSEYSAVEIANYLCFSSESYFISVFRRYTGLTPKRFRELYYRNKFSKSE
jgi:AraC-like DNA-binding protein